MKSVRSSPSPPSSMQYRNTFRSSFSRLRYAVVMCIRVITSLITPQLFYWLFHCSRALGYSGIELSWHRLYNAYWTALLWIIALYIQSPTARNMIGFNISTGILFNNTGSNSFIIQWFLTARSEIHDFLYKIFNN